MGLFVSHPAITRRGRLDRDQMVKFKDNLERRLKQVLAEKPENMVG